MSKTKGNAGRVIAVGLAFVVLTGGVCACGYASRNDENKWFSNSDFASWHWSDKLPDTSDKDQNGGNVKPGGNTAATVGGSDVSVEYNGVTVYKAALPRAAFAAMGVSEQAESAYTLTAEVSPDYASDKSLNWTDIAWQNSESEWATGKTVTDYVTVTPSENGSSAVLTCLQDFGEPIVLTVSSVSNPEVFATCFINYYQRVKSCDFAIMYDGEEITPTIENGVYKVDYTGAEKDYTVELRPVYSNFTLTDTYTTTTSGALTSAFGYSATLPLNSLTIPAGITGGEPKDTDANSLRNALKGIVNLAESGATGEDLGLGMGQYYKSVVLARNALNGKHSNHPFYLHVKDLIENFSYSMTDYYGTQMPIAGNGASVSDIKSRLNSYVAPVYNYYGASIASYNDFVTAVKNCNNSGAGVIEYTVTINGARSNFTTVLSLSYNDDIKTNVQDVNLSDTNVAF